MKHKEVLPVCQSILQRA